jgi:hypothetical protein
MQNDIQIDPLTGGSMSELHERSGWIVKYYAGSIERGHEKLVEEHRWLSAIPQSGRASAAELFPATELVVDPDGRRTELHVRKFERVTISKALLADRLGTEDAVAWFDLAMEALLATVYPLRCAAQRPGAVRDGHRRRLAFAENIFSRIEALQPLLAMPTIRINDEIVPGLGRFAELMIEKHGRWLDARLAYAVHGNLHFDNILVEPEARPTSERVTLIDPRGDLLGPVHYDTAKLMTSAHSYYDEIHYDRYRLERESGGYRLAISPFAPKTYDALLQAVRRWTPQFAELDGIGETEALRAMLCCEAIHTYSFAAYHASRSRPNFERVEVYLLIAALLAAQADALIDAGLEQYAYRRRLHADTLVK